MVEHEQQGKRRTAQGQKNQIILAACLPFEEEIAYDRRVLSHDTKRVCDLAKKGPLMCASGGSRH